MSLCGCDSFGRTSARGLWWWCGGSAGQPLLVLATLASLWPWLKLVLGVALLLLLGWLVDWPETWRTLRQSDPWLVLLSAALLVSALVVSTAKWERLVRHVCGRLGFPALLRAYWIGSFLSNYLPSNVGGDVPGCSHCAGPPTWLRSPAACWSSGSPVSRSWP